MDEAYKECDNVESESNDPFGDADAKTKEELKKECLAKVDKAATAEERDETLTAKVKCGLVEVYQITSVSIY